MKARYLDAIWVSGVVQYNPQGCFIKFYGLICWGWAVVGSDSWDFQKYAINAHLLKHLSDTPKNRFGTTWTVSFFHRFGRFPCQKWGQTGSKTGPSFQAPGPSPKCQEYYLEHPWFFWHRGGAFGNRPFGRDFHPGPPCPPGRLTQKLSVQGCLNISN